MTPSAENVVTYAPSTSVATAPTDAGRASPPSPRSSPTAARTGGRRPAPRGLRAVPRSAPCPRARPRSTRGASPGSTSVRNPSRPTLTPRPERRRRARRGRRAGTCRRPPPPPRDRPDRRRRRTARRSRSSDARSVVGRRDRRGAALVDDERRRCSRPHRRPSATAPARSAPRAAAARNAQQELDVARGSGHGRGHRVARAPSPRSAAVDDHRVENARPGPPVREPRHPCRRPLSTSNCGFTSTMNDASGVGESRSVGSTVRNEMNERSATTRSTGDARSSRVEVRGRSCVHTVHPRVGSDRPRRAARTPRRRPPLRPRRAGAGRR